MAAGEGERSVGQPFRSASGAQTNGRQSGEGDRRQRRCVGADAKNARDVDDGEPAVAPAAVEPVVPAVESGHRRLVAEIALDEASGGGDAGDGVPEPEPVPVLRVGLDRGPVPRRGAVRPEVDPPTEVGADAELVVGSDPSTGDVPTGRDVGVAGRTVGRVPRRIDRVAVALGGFPVGAATVGEQSTRSVGVAGDDDRQGERSPLGRPGAAGVRPEALGVDRSWCDESVARWVVRPVGSGWSSPEGADHCPDAQRRDDDGHESDPYPPTAGHPG